MTAMAEEFAPKVKAKRKTPARKAAKRVPAITNGNGSLEQAPEGLVEFPPAELTEPRGDVRPPEEFVPTTRPVVDEPADELVHPYGDRRVYVFQPADGAAPIVFPHLTAVRPTYHFLWRLRKLKLDQVQQSFEWMDMAEVPDDIQERVASLPDEEQTRFFIGWFEPAVQPAKQGAGPPGES